MKNQIKFEIKSAVEFNDFSELSGLGGCADYGGVVGLDGFQVDFQVEVTNQEGETGDFYICFQSEERNNGMMNYAGWEMATTSAVDDDCSKLARFLDDDEGVVKDALEEEARRLAKAELERVKNVWLEDKGFPVRGNGELAIKDLEDLQEFIDALSAIDSNGDDRWVVGHIESKNQELELGLKFDGYDLDYSALPNFGGKEPQDTTGIWSWDEKNLLISNEGCDPAYEVISRIEHDKEPK